MSWKREGDRITVELRPDQWAGLMLAFGYATGVAMKSEDRRLAYSLIRLTNDINKGNPDYTPYELEDIPE